MRPIVAILIAALAATPALAQVEQHQLDRPDGSTIHYSVDRPADTPTGTIVIAQGSGCLPVAKSANLTKIRVAFPSHMAIMVEKAGVAPTDPVTDGFADCPDSFHAQHTVTQRVADYEAVLDHLDAPRPLILFGGSEGGLVVAKLAARTTPDAAIILSSATGIPFSEVVLSSVPPEGQDQVQAGLAAAAADPEGVSIFAGSSHRFWADILQHIAADDMLTSDSPFLIVQGGLDTSSPIAAARLTADRFAAEGRCNLTYWEFPVLDHAMVDPDGVPHMDEIAEAAANWSAKPFNC